MTENKTTNIVGVVIHNCGQFFENQERRDHMLNHTMRMGGLDMFFMFPIFDQLILISNGDYSRRRVFFLRMRK